MATCLTATRTINVGVLRFGIDRHLPNIRRITSLRLTTTRSFQTRDADDDPTSPLRSSLMNHHHHQQQQSNQEEWTIKTTEGRNNRRRRRRNQNQPQPQQQSATILSAAMNNLMLNEQDDDNVSLEVFEAAMQQCRMELLRSEFYQAVLEKCGKIDDDDNNNAKGTANEIVCYGVGNFYTARPSAPMWQLALAFLLREHYCNDEERIRRSTKGGKNGRSGPDDVPMYYFEPRMTTKEQEYLEQKARVHVIADNERGCRPIGSQGRTLFFMPHCPMALYSNVLYTNWNGLDRIVIFGNPLSNYLDGTQPMTAFSASNLKRKHHPQDPSDKKRSHSGLERNGSNDEKSNNNINNKEQPRHNQRLSKALSWALRHNAHNIGLTIREDGYVPVQEILNCRHSKLASAKPTLEAIQDVVQDNDKQRFKLDHRPRHLYYPKENEYVDKNGDDDTILCIRANQGHSMSFIDPELLLRQLTADELRSTPCIVHGTYLDAWKTIQRRGLSKMTRTHVHFAKGLPDQEHVISGMRKSATVYIFVDAAQCAKDGVAFFESDNGVLLSDGLDGVLPTRYFSHVTEASTGRILLDQRTTDVAKDVEAAATTTTKDTVDTTPTATALDILMLLQPLWKEASISISKKDVADRPAKFEQAFNDSSFTFFPSEEGSRQLLPRPEKIVDIDETGEVF